MDKTRYNSTRQELHRIGFVLIGIANIEHCKPKAPVQEFWVPQYYQLDDFVDGAAVVVAAAAVASTLPPCDHKMPSTNSNPWTIDHHLLLLGNPPYHHHHHHHLVTHGDPIPHVHVATRHCHYHHHVVVVFVE